jgi:hypothetical protein
MVKSNPGRVVTVMRDDRRGCKSSRTGCDADDIGEGGKQQQKNPVDCRLIQIPLMVIKRKFYS